MIYLSWAAHYEGASDRAYFDVLIPRLMEDIALKDGRIEVVVPPSPVVRLGLSGRSVTSVAKEVCALSDAAHLIFIHADAGGREVQRSLNERSLSYCESCNELCGWNLDKCIEMNPRHEMEAWALADAEAVTQAMGYAGNPSDLGLPRTAAEAEGLVNPKIQLERGLEAIRGRRTHVRISQVLPSIAQLQSIEQLRQSASFRTFEEKLRAGMASLGCI